MNLWNLSGTKKSSQCVVVLPLGLKQLHIMKDQGLNHSQCSFVWHSTCGIPLDPPVQNSKDQDMHSGHFKLLEMVLSVRV